MYNESQDPVTMDSKSCVENPSESARAPSPISPPSVSLSEIITSDQAEDKTTDLDGQDVQSPKLPISLPNTPLEEIVTTLPSVFRRGKFFDVSSRETDGQDLDSLAKKSVLFDTVTVYHFTRSQGFTSIPSQGGSTLGMKRRHFLRRKLSVDLFEEVRRRSRREILLKIKLEKHKNERLENEECAQLHFNSVSLSTSSTSNTNTSESDDESFSDYSDISDSELEHDSYVFCQPIGVKLRRSLLRASGVCRIDPKEKKECKVIRESRDRSGCNCVNQCIPELCECSLLGVNCHVDRVSFPCGCVSTGCRNPLGRTEFDIKRVKQHLYDKLFKVVGIG